MTAAKLTDNAEVLLRQIHPNFLHDGEPSSDRFRPSERDANMLSVDRGSMTHAADAHTIYTSTGALSAAVFGVSVGEFAGEAVPCVSDAIEATDTTPANPAHALADFNEHSVGRQKLISKKLKRAAVSRGQLHP